MLGMVRGLFMKCGGMTLSAADAGTPLGGDVTLGATPLGSTICGPAMLAATGDSLLGGGGALSAVELPGGIAELGSK